jgi:hypothetical protein
VTTPKPKHYDLMTAICTAVFGIPALIGVGYAAYILFAVYLGAAGCDPTTMCQ